VENTDRNSQRKDTTPVLINWGDTASSTTKKKGGPKKRHLSHSVSKIAAERKSYG